MYMRIYTCVYGNYIIHIYIYIYMYMYVRISQCQSSGVLFDVGLSVLGYVECSLLWGLLKLGS